MTGALRLLVGALSVRGRRASLETITPASSAAAKANPLWGAFHISLPWFCKLPLDPAAFHATSGLELKRARLSQLLAQGIEAYGFRGAVWTRAWVADVIEQEFGVKHDPSHVWYILRACSRRL